MSTTSRGPKTDRRSRQADESRKAILEATLEIASERGYDGTTVALVSQHSGLPASSTYWHFGNKEQLLAAALLHSYEKWKAKSLRRVRAVGNLSTREQLVQRFQVAAARNRPEFWTIGLLLVLENRIGDREARKTFANIRKEMDRELHDWWSGLLGSGDGLRAGLVDDLVDFQFAILDGLYVHALTTGQRNSRELVELVAHGLADYLANEGVILE